MAFGRDLAAYIFGEGLRKSEAEAEAEAEDRVNNSKHIHNILLWGDLGAGKTTLLKGLGEGMQIGMDIISPSFQLVRNYEGRQVRFTHIDLYRLKSIEEILHLGWWDLLDGDGITAVEWADRARDIWPDRAWFVHIKAISENNRIIELYDRKESISDS